MKSSAKKNWLQKSKSTISSLKKTLELLTQKEKTLETEEKKLEKSVEKPKQEVRVVLSVESVIKSALAVLCVVGFAYLLYFIKDILILFLVALFLSAAFNPAVDRLERYRIPRGLGIVLMYILVLGVITLIFTSLVPIIAEDVGSLAIQARAYVINLVSGENQDSWLVRRIQSFLKHVWDNVDQTQILNSLTTGLREIGSRLTSFAGNAIGAIFTVFNGIFNLILVLILTFFMVVNRQGTSDFFRSLFPRKYSGYITEKTKEVSVRIGGWVRGQLLLALAMALLTFVIFTVIGLNYALTLAMVSALGEFLPYIGPLLTFVSAALIALNQDPALLWWLIPAYMVIQFLEGNIMVPLIVGKSVGLNPIVILFALLTGATIGIKIGGSFALGLVGMIIAVPMANILSIFVEDYTGRMK